MKNKTRKDTQLIDQEGLGFLSQQFAKVGCTLNEQRREIGIDAILEVREDSYTGSGKFIALQVKSGDSYLINETGDELESLKQRDILPIFIRPLTSNGHRLNEFLRRKGYPIHDRLYINCGGLGVKYFISPP